QTVVIADCIRQALGLEKYKPTADEINRYVEEIELYERRVTHLQYSSSREEIEFAVKNIPVEITGEPTDPVEVSGYRNLPRVETNRLRGGAILVLNDGIIGRAHKLQKIIKELKITGWDWLDTLVEMRKEGNSEENENTKSKVGPDYKYLSDVIAGRPVFSHPMRIGGFRLRYGRSRNTGLAAVGLNPVTMYVLDGFLAPGTHIRTERPGKGAIVMPVTTIEGPTVLLSDGSVVKVNKLSELKELLKKNLKVKKVLYLGDILIGFGEFLENNHILLPSPYVEEWWISDLERNFKKIPTSKVPEVILEKVKRLLENPFYDGISFEEAFTISKLYQVPLHPKFLYYWNILQPDDVVLLYDFLFLNRESLEKNNEIPLDLNIKNILERAGIPHRLDDEKKKIIFDNDVSRMLFTVFSLSSDKKYFDKSSLQSMSSIEILNKISPVCIRSKGEVFIGARMGRPEKAKPRKMSPPVHGLFPVGSAGGKSRDILEAIKKGKIVVETYTRKCTTCGLLIPFPICPVCKNKTVPIKYCSDCKIIVNEDKCPKCGKPLKEYSKMELDIRKIFETSEKRGILINKSKMHVKGVKGLSSAKKIPEILDKAILRAKYNIFVFKDGTVRFDATDAPLTHFRPREIGASIETLKKLGYTRDIYGDPLTSEDQILELKVQDIIISKHAGDYLLRVSKFIDELLEKVYGLPSYYNCNKKEDLIGHLVIGLAPHTSAGIIGRIIGFTKSQVTFAHPFWHAAKRRNCDGDEDSIILLLDGFLNFSKSFLPKKRGGTMDAPLVLTIYLNPFEVDDESWNLDVMKRYPYEFYQLTHKFVSPKEALEYIEIAEKRLGTPFQYGGFLFTHDTDQIDIGPDETIYKRLKTMTEKVNAQLNLAQKINAVDVCDVARKVVTSHFLPDIIGSLRSFLTQSFRCLNCNTKYRRVPLSGTCLKCGGKIALTVPKGSVTKYLSLAKKIAEDYNLDTYLKERLLMIEKNIEALFKELSEEETKALSLEDFFS
ncbi:MAG: DNA polymerase II large subunit, partial [Candidatus Asgardarchaeia archaeon]